MVRWTNIKVLTRKPARILAMLLKNYSFKLLTSRATQISWLDRLDRSNQIINVQGYTNKLAK